MIRLTRRYRFSASHRLHTNALGSEENRAVYGKCNNPFGHGHDYVLEVSVAGALDQETGRVADPGALDALVHSEVLSRFDAADLNRLEEFSSLVPTTEYLAVTIRRRLCAAWPAGWPALERLRIEETPRNRFEVGRQ